MNRDNGEDSSLWFRAFDMDQQESLMPPERVTDRRKLFVLDTNVILHDAGCIERFEDISRMVGHSMYAHVTLEKGERSALADLASERL